jgi:tRNA pseudouridine55 synthase
MTRTVFRSLDGILLLDKPAGMSSNQALQRVRHLLRAEKGGHTGSLDPLATGLLPLCFGEATKIAGFLLGSAKAYEAEVRFGITTDTDDADGSLLLQRSLPVLDAARIAAELQGFVGRIRQRPPIYSALKRGGEPLYAKARRGELVEVAEREVEVHAIELLSLQEDRLRLRIRCGSGTYIRSIVRDLGERLGCGAHVTVLRRLWVAPFVAPSMITLDALQALAEPDREARLLPVEAGLVDWPRLLLDSDQARRLGQGQRFTVDVPPGRLLAVDAAGRALGLVEVAADGGLSSQRLFRWTAEAALAGPGQ